MSVPAPPASAECASEPEKPKLRRALPRRANTLSQLQTSSWQFCEAGLPASYGQIEKHLVSELSPAKAASRAVRMACQRRSLSVNGDCKDQLMQCWAASVVGMQVGGWVLRQ